LLTLTSLFSLCMCSTWDVILLIALISICEFWSNFQNHFLLWKVHGSIGILHMLLTMISRRLSIELFSYSSFFIKDFLVVFNFFPISFIFLFHFLAMCQMVNLLQYLNKYHLLVFNSLFETNTVLSPQSLSTYLNYQFSLLYHNFTLNNLGW
jgi:hypothetical protein